jgi:membrane protein DedA with SNARE-associated domain
MSSFATELFNTLFSWIGKSYLAIFILMIIESTSIPIIFPAELVLFLAGVKGVASGNLNFILVIICSVTGSIIGSLLNYSLAYYIGKPFLYRYGKYMLLPADRLHKIEDIFIKYSNIATFAGRLMPLVKHIISIPAGFSQMPLKKFVLWTGLGSVLLSVIMVMLGVFIGRAFAGQQEKLKQYLMIASILLGSFIILIYYFYVKYFYPLISNKIAEIKSDKNNITN